MRQPQAPRRSPLDYLSELARAQAVRNAYLAWIDCDRWCPKYCPCPDCRPLWRFIRANLPVVRREVLR